MGYNFFNGKKVPRAINNKLSDFLESFGETFKKRKNVSFADRDIAYSLELQQDRIKSKDLEIDYKIYPRGKNKFEFIPLSDWKDMHYLNTVCSDFCGIKRVVRKNGKAIYKDDKKSVVYGTVTDVISGVHPDDDPFSCPNCGFVSTVSGLQDGCPQCGTKFKMDDLFPKVSSFYFLDDSNVNKGEFKSLYKKLYFVSLVILYILVSLMHPDMFSLSAMKENNFLMISGVVALIITNFIATYMGTIFFIYIRGMVKLIVNSNKFGTVGSRRRFESRMQKVSPEFSYEYFTSKAISLIKTAVFSEDEKELALYVGDRLDLRMKDIIDLNYGGALGVIKFKDEGDFVTVKTKAYFDVLYAKGNKVYYKPQVFSATLKRRTDIPVDFNFSMTKISCPSCGASFDATKLKKCPYCENEYDITSDDWALIELKYN